MSIHTTPNQVFCSEFLKFFKVSIVKTARILPILKSSFASMCNIDYLRKISS